MFARLARLIPGLLLYGVADAFMIRAAVGVDPWTVFAQGLSLQTGLGIGVLTNIVGVLVLLLWWPLRQKPGIGTVLNILLVGPGIELGLWLLPTPQTLVVRILFFAIGLLLLAVASGIYIGANLGPGPRDGLMTGIHRRFGSPIWVGRTGVEVTVLLIGWWLGGNVGVGTVVFAVLIGPLCSITLPLFAGQAIRRPATSPETDMAKPAASDREAPLPN
ncbi:membrane protein YczE [Leucobacter japonicus]|uniref:membrane protein YczE n=1 Tax=Leucobacter japonicus TaxID=1461259 RepID=UPI0006A7D12C|nr:membrane protein [Leucobacter japonicus]